MAAALPVVGIVMGSASDWPSLEPAAALRDLPGVRVADDTAGAVRHGVVFPAPLLGMDPTVPGPHRVLDGSGRLLAVYRVEGRAARPEVVLG